MVDTIQTYIQNPQQLTRRAFFDPERMAGTVPVWESHENSPNSVVNTTAKGRVLASRDISGEVAAGKPPSLSFGEFIDVINPLHHIPVVGDLYRKYTGDDISSVAKIIGGGIYGGPIGFASSVANAAVEEHSGKTMADNVAHAFNASGHRDAVNVELANKKTPPPSQRWHFNG